jgi:2,3-bisphosphoglycerate-independent phosphoglycerate mutase
MNNIKDSKTTRPVVLVVLDGWGVSQDYPGNAISRANKPVFDNLIAEYPVTVLRASGEAVGLVEEEVGNVESGYSTLGTGRILRKPLLQINKEIDNGGFFSNQVLLKAIKHTKKNKSKLNLLGLVSDAESEASLKHLFALINLAKEQGVDNLALHIILDGCDTVYNSGINFVKEIEEFLREKNLGEIATISGRYYAMDRDKNWDRIEKAYVAMVKGEGNLSANAIQAIEKSYEKNIYDEKFVPTIINFASIEESCIRENDALIFFNFSPDRARQLTQAFVEFDDRFSTFNFKNLFFATFIEYEKFLPVKIAFPRDDVKNNLGQVLSDAGLKQLRIAETEKYVPLTAFFNGGEEEILAGEERRLIPSVLASYDANPEMSAVEITKNVVEALESEKYDFILVNYANLDILGRSGNLSATIKAVETVDKCLGTVVRNTLLKNGVVLITSSHGNAEMMLDMQTGAIEKGNTSNPVPLLMVGKEYAGINIGWPDLVNNDLSLLKTSGELSDLAPSILKLFGLEKPKEMEGNSLIKNF